MGRYFSCNGESAVSTCDPYSWEWDCKRVGSAPDKAGRDGGVTTTATTTAKLVRIRKFSHSELVAATRGFSPGCFLGKGSHGSVYRAALDGGRLTAAVKRAKIHVGGNFFENEVEVLSRVRGPRIVNLIGVCDRGGGGGGGDGSVGDRLIVVEYMPNGCLDDLLHRSRRPPGWTDRVRFALQVAKAVRGLHELDPPVMHRDIKSSNVLIDGKWNARLGDFGLALRGHAEGVRARSTPPAGTLGYLDPAYTAPGDLSEKSDVFSFGILLLEIISGRNAIDLNYSPPSIVDWAMPLIKSRKYRNICDPRVGPPRDIAIVRLVAVLAAHCVRGDARRRPSMSEVVERLETAREKVRAIRLWASLRRHPSSVDATEVVVTEDGCKRLGSGRRRTRKVSSSISNPEPAARRDRSGAAAAGCGGRPAAPGTNRRVVRSRSVGPGSSPVRRRQVGHGVIGSKWAVAVRLNKSRSVGAHAGDYSRELAAGGNDSDSDEESDNKWLEKPLVVTVN